MAEETTTATTLNRGRPPHASSAARRDAIFQLKEQGLTGVAIARALGITPAAVSYHLNREKCDENG